MALSDLIRPRVCELGKIKIGGLGETKTSRAGNAYRQPVKHDYFTVTTLVRDAAGDLIPDAELMASLKDLADADGKLRQLPISLLSNDLDDVMQAAYVWYNGKRLAAKSDGKTLTRYFDPSKGAWLATPETKPWKPEYADLAGPDGAKFFKLHITLNCVVAAPAARWGGVYKFRSTSQITAEGLYGSFTQLRMLTGGQLRGLPLRLVVRPIQVAPEGKTTTVYVVHAELRGPDLQAIQQLALERAKYEIDNAKQLGELRQQYLALLAAPGDEDAAEAAEIAAELHPEPQGEGVTTTTHTATGRMDNGEPIPASATTFGGNPPTGGQHTSPPPPEVMATPEELEATYGNQIGEAATEADLDAIVNRIKSHFAAGLLKVPHRDRVAGKVKARRAEIKAEATTNDRAEANGAADPKS